MPVIVSMHMLLQVRYAEQQIVKEHVKKDYIVPSDPGWPKQWVLVGVCVYIYLSTHTHAHTHEHTHTHTHTHRRTLGRCRERPLRCWI